MPARDADQVSGNVGVQQVHVLPLAGKVDGLLQMTELDGAWLLAHPRTLEFMHAQCNRNRCIVRTKTSHSLHGVSVKLCDSESQFADWRP